MNFQLQLYSSDVKSPTPSACYQFNFDSYGGRHDDTHQGKRIRPQPAAIR